LIPGRDGQTDSIAIATTRMLALARKNAKLECSTTVLERDDSSRTKLWTWPWHQRLGLQSCVTNVLCAIKLKQMTFCFDVYNWSWSTR